MNQDWYKSAAARNGGRVPPYPPQAQANGPTRNAGTYHQYSGHIYNTSYDQGNIGPSMDFLTTRTPLPRRLPLMPFPAVR